ncbi:hypothetical protein [uncultured Dubosiella sp.]|uniref:hypothetical protein n=1 Tax=uncultured Dubosiella sp. TaxID=1937011 RepID=UPI00259329F0|nr:hypothetical protein [uncultured Dubosiella sp.]
MKTIPTTIDGRQVVLYDCEQPASPLVVLIASSQIAPAVLKVCARLDPIAFHLLVFDDLHWDEDLSPWPHEPVVQRDDHFTGDASRFLQIVQNAVSWAKRALQADTPVIVAGYSMGGLFALYAAYMSTMCEGVVCASGSVWYPGFYEFATTHSMKGQPKAIYLSLGDKESRTSNPYLRQTGTIMEKLARFYKALHIPCVLEWNPGNHFVDADLRLAKGIVWTLQQLSIR